MRITYLIDNLLRAGTQTALGYLVEGLAGRGYHQQVFCLNRRFDPGVAAELEAGGARVFVLGKAQLLSGYGLGRLFAALRRTDVVQTLLPFSDVLGRTLGRLAGVPCVITSIRARNIDKKPWQLQLDRWTMPLAHRVIFNARSVADWSIEHEGVRTAQVVVIPNGVRFRSPSGAGRAVLDGIVPPEAPVIGTVGRLRPQKGHADLLRALALLRDGGLPAAPHLLVIGEGELREALGAQAREAGVADHVHFLGTRTDLPDLFAVMDVYAHPARFEGMPNAVMEAMAAGVPVVAAGVDGVLELVEDGVTGWVIPPGSASELAERLQTVLQSPHAAGRVAAAGARRVREEYSPEQMVDAFDDLYRGKTGTHTRSALHP